MKKIIISALFLFLIIPVPVSSEPKIIGVSVKIGSASIQEMIDSAEEGEKIKIPPGTYEENIRIDKTITLEGEKVMLKGTVKIEADNVRISGFTFTEYNIGLDGSPVLEVTGNEAEISGNTFIKTEDAFEILIKGSNAKIKENVFEGLISTDSGMVKIEADKAEILENRFVGAEGGQWGPLQVLISDGFEIKISGNRFENASDKAILIGGRGLIKLEGNKFSENGIIFLGDKPEKLNGISDMAEAKDEVESLNKGSEVVYGFERDLNLQEIVDSAQEGQTIFLPAGVYKQDLVVGKSLDLKGKNVTLKGKILVTADNVTISKFRFLDGNDDYEPVIKIEGRNAKISENYFDTIQDANEVLIDEEGATIEENVFYSASPFERTWSMVLVTGKGQNVRIIDNGFIGSSSHGLFSPIILNDLAENQTAEINRNHFSNTKQISISAIGKGAILNILNNTQDLKQVLIKGEPRSLNNFADIQKGAENIEEMNSGAMVVLEF